MKVQLVQPTTGAYDSNSRSGCYAPLGLVSMATFVKQQEPGIEVAILDGELMEHDELLRHLDADIVGINSNTVTHPQAVKVASAAKARGAHVVLGGVFPTAVPDLVEKNRKDVVDTLVVGYGERALLEVIRRGTKGRIVNHNPELDVLPTPDRTILPLHHYINQFSRNHPSWEHRATNLFTNVGCKWRDKSRGGCVFCSRSGMQNTAFRPPSMVWSEVRTLVERYGVDYIVDFSDTTLQDLDWLRALVETKPRDLTGPDWHLFARIDEITPEAIDLVEQLPCRHLFVGVEAGHPKTYRAARKGGGTPESALVAASLLRKRGIEITPSYVVGLPGEDEKTLAATFEHAQRLKDISQFEEIFCCELMPFPGSIAFERYRVLFPIEHDVLDIEELKRNWADRFCNVSFDRMQDQVQRILKLGKYPITISKGARFHPPTVAAGNQATISRSHEGAAKEQYTCV